MAEYRAGRFWALRLSSAGPLCGLGQVKINGTCTRPRSGLGLNELLARTSFWSPAFSCGSELHVARCLLDDRKDAMELPPKPPLSGSKKIQRSHADAHCTEVLGQLCGN